MNTECTHNNFYLECFAGIILVPQVVTPQGLQGHIKTHAKCTRITSRGLQGHVKHVHKMHSGTSPRLTGPRKTHAKCTVVTHPGLQDHVNNLRTIRTVVTPHGFQGPVKHEEHALWLPPNSHRARKTCTKCTVVPPQSLQGHVKQIHKMHSGASSRLTGPRKTLTKCTVGTHPGLQDHVKHLRSIRTVVTPQGFQGP